MPSFFELVDKVRQAKCFLCFLCSCTHILSSMGSHCCFTVVQSFDRADCWFVGKSSTGISKFTILLILPPNLRCFSGSTKHLVLQNCHRPLRGYGTGTTACHRALFGGTEPCCSCCSSPHGHLGAIFSGLSSKSSVSKK